MNPELASVECIIYIPLQILICIACKIIISLICLVQHCRSSQHQDSLIDQIFVDNLVTTYNLYSLDYFALDNAPNTPVPEIQWEKGYVCGINDCTTTSTSSQTMKHHMSRDHRVVRTPPLKSFV